MQVELLSWRVLRLFFIDNRYADLFSKKKKRVVVHSFARSRQKPKNTRRQTTHNASVLCVLYIPLVKLAISTNIRHFHMSPLKGYTKLRRMFVFLYLCNFDCK